MSARATAATHAASRLSVEIGQKPLTGQCFPKYANSLQVAQGEELCHIWAMDAADPETEEIEVTPEMVAAGLKALYDSGLVLDGPAAEDRHTVSEIFRAMASTRGHAKDG